MKTLFLTIFLCINTILSAQTGLSLYLKAGGSQLLADEPAYSSNLALLFGGGMQLSQPLGGAFLIEFGVEAESKKGVLLASDIPLFDVNGLFLDALFSDDIRIQLFSVNLPIGLAFQHESFVWHAGIRASFSFSKSGTRIRKFVDLTPGTNSVFLPSSSHTRFSPDIRTLDLGLRIGGRYPVLPRLYLGVVYFRSLLGALDKENSFIVAYKQQHISLNLSFQIHDPYSSSPHR